MEGITKHKTALKGAEDEFIDEVAGPLYEAIKEEIEQCHMHLWEKIPYQVTLDGDCEKVLNKREYQTDMTIKQGTRLKLILEFKVRSGSKNDAFTTHDVIDYSHKAEQHKELFPQIRYGLVAGNVPSIHNKLFYQNRGLDFAVAMKDSQDIERLAEIVIAQYKCVGTMEKLRNLNMTPKYFSNEVRIE